MDEDMEDAVVDSEQCTSPMGTRFYRNIDKNRVSTTIDEMLTSSQSDACTASLSSPYGSNIGEEVERANKRKRYMDDEIDFSEDLEWTTRKYFIDEWMVTITKYQKHLFPAPSDIKRDHAVWFEYVFDRENPIESKFRCRLCHKYYDKFKLALNYRNALVDGVIGTRQRNLELLKKHAQNAGNCLLVIIDAPVYFSFN